MYRTLLVSLILCSSAMLAGEAVVCAVTPEDALGQLREGNKRFANSRVAGPHRDAARRIETVKNGQHPIAAVISCADSRAPVELLFDQGVGDIFSIRVAGNVANTDEIGTAEYGVEHLGAPLLLVLGHTSCGAVTAVCTHEEVHGSIGKLVAPIVPAVEKVRKEHPDLKDEDLVPFAIEANVWQAISDLLTRSETIRNLVRTGKLRIEGGVYDLETGKIKWLGQHPHQDALIAEFSFARER